MNFDILKMLNPDVYEHPVSRIQLIETHISWVILTGDYAYKIKKPVNFGFLDFSTLQKRQQYCKQEVRLNRRLTTNIYIAVIHISIQQQKLKIGQGKAIEYGIKMKQFAQSAQLDNMLAAGQLETHHIDAIALMIARFHLDIQTADKSTTYGEPESLFQPVMENFKQITEQLENLKYKNILTKLLNWSKSQFEQLEGIFQSRKQQGFIRECHGDLHLRNLVWLGDKNTIEPDKGPMAFDCIEFNENLRWIDVISEVAFLVMDLHDRKQTKLANRFLNSYLELTGDYSGLVILPFYLSYRAMVRAKVAILRLRQPDIDTTDKKLLLKEFETYLELAQSYIQRSTPKLIIMRGVSASGKSTISQQLVDKLGAIRLRSDVERKRLVSEPEKQNKSVQINKGLYSEKVTEQTYAKLLELADSLMRAGFSVIIDAAFLQHQQRKPFQQLAERLNVRYFIVETTAPAKVLRRRIVQRKNNVSDADLNVLEYQLKNWEPLLTEEISKTLSINSLETLQIGRIIKNVSAS